MSLRTITSGFLAIAPKVWEEGELLRARTNLLAQLATLFCASRHLTVDPSRRVITVHSRFLWFLSRERTIPFDAVDYVESDYSSMGTSWGYNAQRTDEIDRYITYLVLKDEERIKLFTFAGEGAVQTGWTGMLLSGDTFYDASGNQDALNRQFLVALKESIGCSIGKPVMHLADETGTRFACLACDRPAPPRRGKCLYCGGETGPCEE